MYSIPTPTERARMSALSQKETHRVLRSLADQGSTLVKTKSGFRVLFPNGGSTAIHWTTSDHRATKNLRADVLRAGLTWPSDHKRELTRMDPRRVQTLAKLSAGLRRVPEEGFTTAQILDATGLGHASIARLLPDLGYEISRSPLNNRTWIWNKVVSQPQPPVQEAPAASPEPEEYPEIERAKALVPVAPAPRPEPPRPATATPVREFLDSVESWTVTVPPELVAMADQFNLHIECRVWRKEH